MGLEVRVSVLLPSCPPGLVGHRGQSDQPMMNETAIEFGDNMPPRKETTVSQRLRLLTTAVIFFLLLLLPLASVAQENADRLVPMDVFSVQVASDPQISPDGKHIVYVRQSADVGSDRRVSNL